MIQSVYEVGPKLETKALLEAEALGQRQIHNREARPAQRVSAGSAEGAVCGVLKGGRIEIESMLNVYARKGVADSVEIPHATAALRIVVCGVGIINCERIAALGDECSCNAPSSDRKVGNGVAMEESLALPKGKVVRDQAFESVRDIKVRIAIVGVGIVSDLPALTASAAAPSGGVLIIQEVRPYVVDLHGQSMGIALRKTELERVVIGNAPVRIARNVSKEGKWALSLGSGACRQDSRVSNLIDVGRVLQMFSMAADIRSE